MQVNTLNFKGQLNYFKWSSVPFQDSLDKSIISKLKNDFSFKDNDFLWIASGDKADCVSCILVSGVNESNLSACLASNFRANQSQLHRPH